MYLEPIGSLIDLYVIPVLISKSKDFSNGFFFAYPYSHEHLAKSVHEEVPMKYPIGSLENVKMIARKEMMEIIVCDNKIK